MFSRAGIVLTAEEQGRIEVADFGLGKLERVGLQVLTYVNTDRYCAKEIALFPRQTCPEHSHPSVDGSPGKMETLRCRWGCLLLYTEGEPSPDIEAGLPPGSERHYTALHQVRLNPGEQHTVPPGTRHWFQAGDEGAIVSSFSSTSRDNRDVFTDPRVVRETKIVVD
jgi:D-lyxose ketol-isomerase